MKQTSMRKLGQDVLEGGSGSAHLPAAIVDTTLMGVPSRDPYRIYVKPKEDPPMHTKSLTEVMRERAHREHQQFMKDLTPEQRERWLREGGTIIENC